MSFFRSEAFLVICVWGSEYDLQRTHAAKLQLELNLDHLRQIWSAVINGVNGLKCRCGYTTDENACDAIGAWNYTPLRRCGSTPGMEAQERFPEPRIAELPRSDYWPFALLFSPPASASMVWWHWTHSLNSDYSNDSIPLWWLPI